MSRRAARVAVAVALVAIAVAAIALPVFVFGGDEGDPTADELAGAIRDIGACRSLVVREIDNIGGPGLPEGMKAAREIACGTERLALHYVFDDDDAARGWLRDNGYVETPGAYRWRINDGTLVGTVTIPREEWAEVLERAGL